VLMIGSLVTLFVALLAGSIGFAFAREYVPGLDNGVVAYTLSIAVSTAGVFAFLVCAYYLLTNDDDVRVRDVLPGAALATVGLEASFQVLPLYVRYAHVNAAVNVFGGTAILLIWLYVMANVIVFGAELNWWFGRRRAAKVEEGVGLA
jgi:membrane protein